MEFERGNLKIRPLSHEDGPILHRWLNDPRVLAYYEGRDKPHDKDMVEDRFLSKTDPNRILGCLTFWNGSPVGYAQVYPVPDEELSLYGYSSENRIYGMDQFLGEPDMWNQGIGTLLVGTVARWLFQQFKADRVVMDPRTENLRAIHVYEKCGFQKRKLLRQREFHEGKYHDCWLMEVMSQGLHNYFANELSD